MRKPQKFSQAHFLPSLIIVGFLVLLFVLSIGHAINYAATNGTQSSGCSNCGIELPNE
jgi:hypothetical protein